MRQRYVGSSGLRVSRLGLGTLMWGTDTPDHEAEDQLRAFVDAGGTLVDTAAGYAAGASEAILGRLLEEVVPRDEVVIATKAGISRPRGERVVDVSRGALLRQLDESLIRLGVDYVDLWQLHTWSDEVPIDETLTAVDFAVSSGRARYAGASNYSGWQAAQAATHQAAVPGRARLSSIQIEYSLLNRDAEREALQAADALGLGVLAWSPLGRGVLSGKYRSGIPADSRGASPSFERYVGVYLNAQSTQIVEAVCKAADGLELSPVEVALAWVRDRPGIAAALVGARTSAQLAGLLTAEDVTLPDEIAEALDDVSASDGYPAG